MSKVERDSLTKSVLSLDLYQRKQGKLLRRSTGAAIFLAFVLASQALYQTVLIGYPWASAVVLIGCLLGAWFAFRLVNYPVFADFLIEVESEMAKVTWPTAAELWRATIVVLVTMFVLTFLLFGYDILWQKILALTGVLRLTK
jgi:preprotein translocase subunit SecE